MNLARQIIAYLKVTHTKAELEDYKYANTRLQFPANWMDLNINESLSPKYALRRWVSTTIDLFRHAGRSDVPAEIINQALNVRLITNAEKLIIAVVTPAGVIIEGDKIPRALSPDQDPAAFDILFTQWTIVRHAAYQAQQEILRNPGHRWT